MQKIPCSNSVQKILTNWLMPICCIGTTSTEKSPAFRLPISTRAYHGYHVAQRHGLQPTPQETSPM